MTRLSSAYQRSRFDGEIFALALPALGALAADPLLSLIDTAFVGRIPGVDALAALGVAGAVMGLLFFVFNFLAYGTTPTVAVAIGRGELERAGRIVVTGFVLAIALGAVAALVVATAASPVAGLMGATGDVRELAASYLRIRSLALPAMLVVTVGHGAFRGYQDTRTPFVLTVILNLINLVLDPLLIFTAGMGIQGAAWATVVAQWTGAALFLYMIAVRKREALGIGDLRPTWEGLAVLFGAGWALIIRTAALVTTLTLTTAVAARISDVAVAAHQVTLSLWVFLALVVDALAIAGQAMVGRILDSHGPEAAREASVRLLQLGLGAGIALAAFMAALYPILPGVFDDDPRVIDTVSSVYPFVIAMQPVNALVFVWDGIGIGVAAFRFLAAAMVVSSVIGIAALILVAVTGAGLAAVWWSIMLLMASRAATLFWWFQRGPLSATAPQVSPA